MKLFAQIALYFAQEQGGGAELANASEHQQQICWVVIKSIVGKVSK